MKSNFSRIVVSLLLIAFVIVAFLASRGMFNQVGEIQKIKSGFAKRPFLEGTSAPEDPLADQGYAHVLSLATGDEIKEFVLKSYYKKPGEELQRIDEVVKSVPRKKCYLGYVEEQGIIEITLLSEEKGEESILYHLPPEIIAYMGERGNNSTHEEGWIASSLLSFIWRREKTRFQMNQEQTVYYWQTMNWEEQHEGSFIPTGIEINTEVPFDEIEIPEDMMCYFITMTVR